MASRISSAVNRWFDSDVGKRHVKVWERVLNQQSTKGAVMGYKPGTKVIEKAGGGVSGVVIRPRDVVFIKRDDNHTIHTCSEEEAAEYWEIVKKMKIKETCQATCGDFWYDLSHGGYLKPEEMLESAEDAKRVTDAVAVIKEFEKSCEQQIEGFYI